MERFRYDRKIWEFFFMWYEKNIFLDWNGLKFIIYSYTRLMIVLRVA